MEHILDNIETAYIDSQTLLAKLSDYRNRRDWIARMVHKGELIRLKNGFFLIASRFKDRTRSYPYEQLANLLYGPSYVSLEWALSYYHYIPERVYTVTSVTVASNKNFPTAIGTFAYQHLHLRRYTVGISCIAPTGSLSGFLMATPEKALVDWVHGSCQKMSEDELFQDLTDAKRIEKSRLGSLNKPLLEEIQRRYQSRIVHTLWSIVRKL